MMMMMMVFQYVKCFCSKFLNHSYDANDGIDQLEPEVMEAKLKAIEHLCFAVDL